MIYGTVKAHMLAGATSRAKYIAIGAVGETLVSIDGANWVKFTGSLPPTPSGTLEYGNGRFITVVNDGAAIPTPNNIYYTIDGIAWYPAISPIPVRNCFVEYEFGDNKFVLFSVNRLSSTSYAKTQFYSSDGQTWQSMSALPDTNLYCARNVHYGNGYFISTQSNFVGIGPSVSTVQLSTDGLSWTSSTMPSSGDAWDGFSGPSRLFALNATTGDYYISSNNGVSWTTVFPSGGPTNPIPKLYYSSVYLTWDVTNIYYSSDGVNWTSVPNTYSLTSFCVGPNGFLGIKFDGTTTAISSNGSTWTLLTTVAPSVSSVVNIAAKI